MPQVSVIRRLNFLSYGAMARLVPFYPSVCIGILPANGYIEFWGEANDGKADKALYPDPAYQHSTKSVL